MINIDKATLIKLLDIQRRHAVGTFAIIKKNEHDKKFLSYREMGEILPASMAVFSMSVKELTQLGLLEKTVVKSNQYVFQDLVDPIQIDEDHLIKLCKMRLKLSTIKNWLSYQFNPKLVLSAQARSNLDEALRCSK